MTGSIQHRVMMALIGALAGASLHLLGRAISESLLNERLIVALAVFAGTFFAGLLAMAGPLSIKRAAIGAAGVATVAATMMSLAGLRFASVDGLANAPIPAAAGFILGSLPLPFLIARASAGWRDYPTLFTQAWAIFVRYSVASVFVGVVWGVIFLSDALFGVVGLTLIKDLIATPVAPWIITGTVFGLGLAVVTELSDVVSPYLLLRLLRLLLPIVLVVMTIFIAALPFKGLSGLFGDLSVAATLLGMTAAAATLITSAIDQTDAQAATSSPMRRAVQALALILPLPAALGAWSVWLRVAQYGWTPDRLFAATVAVMGLCYGGFYAVAVLRGTGWMDRIRRTNTMMALALIGVAFLWLTPLLNPEVISTRSQMARFADGRTTAESLDISAFSRWGHAGAAARADLEALAAEPGNETLATRLANPGAPTQTLAEPDTAPLQQALVAVMPLQPVGATATRDFLLAAASAGELQSWLTACQTSLPGGTPACVMIVADLLVGSPGEEAMVITQTPDGFLSYAGLALVDGVLERRTVWPVSGDLAAIDAGVDRITALQLAPPALSSAGLNQIETPNGPLLLGP